MPAHWRGSLHEPSQHGPTQREQPISERDTSITMRTAIESARHIQRTLPLKGRLTRGGGRPAPGQVGSAGRAAAERGGGVTIWTYSPPKMCTSQHIFLINKNKTPCPPHHASTQISSAHEWATSLSVRQSVSPMYPQRSRSSTEPRRIWKALEFSLRKALDFPVTIGVERHQRRASATSLALSGSATGSWAPTRWGDR